MKKTLQAFKIICILTVLALLFGCANEQAKPVSQTVTKNLVLYSEVESKFVEEVVARFNAEQAKKKQGTVITLSAIYELKEGASLPHMVLAEKRTLHNFGLQDKLKPIGFAAGDRLPKAYKDAEFRWYGIFYDPVVFLVNHEFSRKIGQQNLRGWSDLEDNEQVRIVMENLSDSNSTRNFLSSLADHYGETTSLNYLWNINRYVTQYAKFPFTAIRLAAAGDADLAITRRSYVAKYLEGNFPAYVVEPQEGTPINLYGVGLFKDHEDDAEAIAFLEWMLADGAVQNIALEKQMGFEFIFPRGLKQAAVKTENLWQNDTYLEADKQAKLTDRWLEVVRFSRK